MISRVDVIEPPRIYRLSVAAMRVLLRVFFRKIEVSGLENLAEPDVAGGILVAWHPNALVDGALILAEFPGAIVVGARHGLFLWPVLGSLLRALGVVPVYRSRDVAHEVDDGRRREANAASIDSMAGAVARGAFALLFPEGQSHDEPSPTELKTGAARVFYRACERTPAGARSPVVVPVGLHYDRKHSFGSNALVLFHPPMEIGAGIRAAPRPDATEGETRERYRALTGELERTLREVVHATESWELHQAMHRARKLMRAERAHRSGASPSRPEMREKIQAFARLWAGYNEKARTHPEEVSRIVARIQSYDADLAALGIEDHELYGGGLLSTRLAVRIVFQALLVYFVLPPILLIGYAVNLPAAVLVLAVSKWGSRARKDVASLKLVVGAIAFPLAWLSAALLVVWGHTRLSTLYPHFSGAPLRTGALAFVLSGVGAFVALHYQRLARRTLRAIRVRLTRWRQGRALERLRAERAGLYDDLRELARGLEPASGVEPDPSFS
jgi:glycerol-3-phosphate O-acyltransferase / dihydroxyacetone phosphate acyltransferase